jgi:TonB-linked SusC/RagA family outer membrane protein
MSHSSASKAGRVGVAVAALLFAATSIQAQTGTLTGRVTDAETEQPIAAVQVAIANLSIGALTQQDGTYNLLNVPAGTHTVSVQRIGYSTVEQPITMTAGGTATLNFEIAEQALSLDAIVVTGTAGATQRRALGNVVTQVQAADIATSVPVVSVAEIIGGRAPGLQFTQTTGVVGSGSSIRIRGVSSVSLGAQPIVFIDGVRASNRTNAGPETGGGASASALDDINPNDIESVEIIKGPAAATLYGTEASAGVINITTKRGAAGAPQFDLTVHNGYRFMMNAADKLGTQYGCRTKADPPCPLSDIFTYNMYDEANNYIRLIRETGTSGLYVGGPTEWNWWDCDELFCNGALQTYSLNVRGGTEAVRYFLSTEFLGDNGVLPWNTNDRINVRANVSTLLFPNFSVDVQSVYTNGDTRLATPVTGQGDVWDDMQWSKGYNLTRINPNASPRLGGFQERTPADIAGVRATREWNRFVGSVTGQYIFHDWLTQRVVFGVDKSWETNINLFPLDKNSAPYREQDDGSVRYEQPIDGNLTLDYAVAASINRNGAIAGTTSAGVQYYERLIETSRVTGRGFALPVQTTFNATQPSQAILDYSYIENKSLGAYFQQEIALNNRLFLTAAIRADDNSAFGGEFDFQTYPKLSASWVVSEEPFFRLPLVNSFRLRTAMGQAGRQPGTFDGRTLWRTYSGPVGTGAVAPDSPGNPLIGPEVSTELELGFDLALLDDRISTEFTYFTRKTEDALLNTALAPSFAQPGSVAQNLGRIDNWGWEASINSRVVDMDNVAFDLTLAGDHVDNEIVELGTFPGSAAVRVGFPTPNVRTDYIVTRWSEEVDRFGIPVEILCDGGTGPGGLLPGGEDVPCSTVRDKSLLLGPSYYTHTFSIAPTLTLFNNVRLIAMAQGMYGKIGSEAQVHWGMRYNNSYCGQARTNDPACAEWLIKNVDGKFYNSEISQSFKADFWKLREVTLMLDIPQSWVARTGANSASLSFSGRELAILWQKQKFLGESRQVPGGPATPGRHIPDPEFQGLYRLPGLSSLTATLRLSF